VCAMAKFRKLDALAQRYLDRFEAEDSAAASDPALGETLDRLSRAWLETMQAGWTLGPRLWNAAGGALEAEPSGTRGAGEGKADDTRAAHGTAPTATASAGGPDELAALRARLDELERRLAELEPAAERGHGPGRGTSRSRS